MDTENIFKPRDFIYLNTNKLDSYFSQLYGGMITNVEETDQSEKGSKRKTSLDTEVAGQFGLGEGSAKLLDLIIGQIGSIDVKAHGGFDIDWIKSNNESSSAITNKTLEHFQYTLFEQSMNKLGYLIDLDEFVEKNPDVEGGIMRENLNSSDFVKFTASSVSISDYRNASEFVKLVKKIIDLSIDIKMSEGNSLATNDSASLRNEAAKKIINSLTGERYDGSGFSEILSTIIEAVDEFFKGDMIPHDILLTSIIELDKKGQLTFESQLQDNFLLENRTELSYKYGFFEDTEWTIIGQITSIKNNKSPNFNEVMEEAAQRFKEIFSKHKEININSTVKEIIKEIDELSKKVGILPLVEERNIAITPIAIYREPNKNKYFLEN